MPPHRLDHETLRSLSRVRPCGWPGTLPLRCRPQTFWRNSSTTSRHTVEVLGRFDVERHHASDRTLLPPSNRNTKQSIATEDSHPSSLRNANFSRPEHDEEVVSDIETYNEEGGLDPENELVFGTEEGALQESPVLPGAPAKEVIERILSRRSFETVVEATSAVNAALADRSRPENALQVFFQATQTEGFLENLGQSTLRTFMLTISPENLLLPYRSIHRDLHPAFIRQYRHRRLHEINAIYYEVLKALLTRIQHLRRHAPSYVFKIMLNICRVCGYSDKAKEVFEALRALPGYEVEVQDYNIYMDTLSWGSALTNERFRLRVTPLRLQERDAALGSARGGYKTGTGGLKDTMITTFQQLKADGLTPDHQSYTNLMLAMAREGLMDEVKWIIKNTWDVDCDNLQETSESELLLENSLAPDNPLYPTRDTLFAIVHAFCINSNVPTAMQVVDVFSQKYELRVEARVWTELLEWAYVVALPRRGSTRKWRRSQEQRVGHFPLRAVIDLWNVASSPPFNTKLNMKQMSLLFKAHFRRDTKVEMINMMLQGEQLASRSYRRWGAPRITPASDHDLMLDDFLNLRMKRDYWNMLKMLKGILATSYSGKSSRMSRDVQWDWLYRTIPDIILRFWTWRPAHGQAYDLPAGRVQFRLRPKGEPPATIALKSSASPLPTSTIEQSTQPTADIPLRSGLTRQRRLQMRHEKRQDAVSYPPKYTPRWSEADDVQDWIATERLQEPQAASPDPATREE